MIETRGLTLNAGPRTLLRSLDWHGQAGELWCVLGANGAGKSSLLYALAGLQAGARSQVWLQGKPLDHWQPAPLARQRSFMPQEVHDAFDASVEEVVQLGRYPHGRSPRNEPEPDLSIARKALVDAGLGDFPGRNVLTLSGGERQRVALAMLLAQDTPLMLLDEPASHQDLGHQMQMFGLLQKLAQAGRCVVLALHDVNLAARFATHALVLDGRDGAMQGSAVEVINAETLSAAYGHPVRAISDVGMPGGAASYFVPV